MLRLAIYEWCTQSMIKRKISLHGNQRSWLYHLRAYGVLTLHLDSIYIDFYELHYHLPSLEFTYEL
jgi:hypothetical protein